MSANARPLRPSGAGARAAAARLPARPFVGRAEELRLLAGALDEAVGGRGSLLLVTGEAGIGKTRLVQELVAVAGRRCHPLFGRCWEEGGAPAYWPWIQVVRAAGGDFGALAAPPAEAPLEPETVRFRLFDAAASQAATRSSSRRSRACSRPTPHAGRRTPPNPCRACPRRSGR